MYVNKYMTIEMTKNGFFILKLTSKYNLENFVLIKFHKKCLGVILMCVILQTLNINLFL